VDVAEGVLERAAAHHVVVPQGVHRARLELGVVLGTITRPADGDHLVVLSQSGGETGRQAGDTRPGGDAEADPAAERGGRLLAEHHLQGVVEDAVDEVVKAAYLEVGAEHERAIERAGPGRPRPA
jgi:hypothetical protein